MRKVRVFDGSLAARAALVAATAYLGGCDASGSPWNDTTAPDLGGTDGGTAGFGGAIAGTGGFGTGGGLPAATDTRPVVTAERTPPPISGGTLLALRSGGRAVLSDPDRDRIIAVDTARFAVTAELTLEPGSEPGRLVEDGAGRVHALLRGSGELLSFDPTTGAVAERRAVCAAPRGVVFDSTSDAVLVACLEGTLVELPAAGGPATRTTFVDLDLRDVVMSGSEVVVTRFRGAELLFLDAERRVVRRESASPPVTDFSTNEFAARVAWRTVATPDAGLLVAHQRSQTTAIDIGAGGIVDPEGSGAAGTAGTGSAGGYSAFGPCSAVVRSTLTQRTADGRAIPAQTFDSITLPVDIAVSATGFIAIANGGFELDSPARSFGASLIVTSRNDLMTSADCGSIDMLRDLHWTVTAVAFDPVSNQLIAQTREPSQILVYDEHWIYRTVNLGGGDVTDTGHEIFHADSGQGMACASCHPEGTDDGHVWQFAGLGPRRTQALDVGLEGTAPFHWDGDLASFGDLLSEVFQRRMGGPSETPERAAALERFVYGIPRRPALRAADDAAAVRGRVVFESEVVACSACHTGQKLTNGETEEIGKGAATQVPSLVAVSARAPFMHDGCAPTLRARFDPACGGTLHGNVTTLEEAQIQDLVAYLESL